MAWFLWADSISWKRNPSGYRQSVHHFFECWDFIGILIPLTGTTVNSTSSEIWSWFPSMISLKWKNIRASLSTHLMKPKPSLIAAITPWNSQTNNYSLIPGVWHLAAAAPCVRSWQEGLNPGTALGLSTVLPCKPWWLTALVNLKCTQVFPTSFQKLTHHEEWSGKYEFKLLPRTEVKEPASTTTQGAQWGSFTNTASSTGVYKTHKHTLNVQPSIKTGNRISVQKDI